MLRSGYSIADVEKDLATRHFLETIDSASEKKLTDAGATSALVSALKSGQYAVPAEEFAKAEREMEAQTRRHAESQAQWQKIDAMYKDHVTRSRANTAVPLVASGNVIAAAVKGDLVTAKNGILSTFNDQPLENKKLIALYFSAHWCAPCRKFTPELVDYYNRVAPSHPEFELIFVSNDRSASAMQAYMNDLQMPWPAIDYDKIAEKAGINNYASKSIPCLVLVNARGQVLSSSSDGEKYLGPQKVLADLDQIFANAGKPAVAQTR